MTIHWKATKRCYHVLFFVTVRVFAGADGEVCQRDAYATKPGGESSSRTLALELQSTRSPAVCGFQAVEGVQDLTEMIFVDG